MTTIDMTPSPAATRNMLQMIIEGSTSADDVTWAKGEMLRCFPPVLVAVDQIHKLLIVGAGRHRLMDYCSAIASVHGAGNCDIYEFPEHDKRLKDIVEFLHADDCSIMHFDYRGQLVLGASA